ncbi:MAG: hypothetical protein LBR32_06450 [Propionibacteriaceae bacterium]|jgi:hypothetical protein|nr:hypothetical protein [Propionibacteriaceae bacterium]
MIDSEDRAEQALRTVFADAARRSFAPVYPVALRAVAKPASRLPRILAATIGAAAVVVPVAAYAMTTTPIPAAPLTAPASSPETTPPAASAAGYLHTTIRVFSAGRDDPGVMESWTDEAGWTWSRIVNDADVLEGYQVSAPTDAADRVVAADADDPAAVDAAIEAHVRRSVTSGDDSPLTASDVDQWAFELYVETLCDRNLTETGRSVVVEALSARYPSATGELDPAGRPATLYTVSYDNGWGPMSDGVYLDPRSNEVLAFFEDKGGPLDHDNPTARNSTGDLTVYATGDPAPELTTTIPDSVDGDYTLVTSERTGSIPESVLAVTGAGRDEAWYFPDNEQGRVMQKKLESVVPGEGLGGYSCETLGGHSIRCIRTVG